MLKRCAPFLLLTASISPPSFAAEPGQQTESAVVSRVKAEVAADIAGINAHNPAEATAHEANDTVFSECGKFVSFGRADYQQGLSMAFKSNPEWHLSLVDEAVVVANSGDQAVYRSSYNEDSMRDGVPYTHQGNYVAGFRRDRDGAWRIHWSTV